MTPYRNVRYWSSDFRSGGKVVGREEIFNLCHERLRNVIEHAFGVVKARFIFFIIEENGTLFICCSNKNSHDMFLHSQFFSTSLSC